MSAVVASFCMDSDKQAHRLDTCRWWLQLCQHPCIQRCLRSCSSLPLFCGLHTCCQLCCIWGACSFTVKLWVRSVKRSWGLWRLWSKPSCFCRCPSDLLTSFGSRQGMQHAGLYSSLLLCRKHVWQHTSVHPSHVWGCQHSCCVTGLSPGSLPACQQTC